MGEQGEVPAMRVRVGCKIGYESDVPTPAMFLVAPPSAYTHRLIEAQRMFAPDVSFKTYKDGFGNEIWRALMPAGAFEITYDAIADVMPTPDPVLFDLPKTPVQDLPDDVLIYTLPSRHCPSDLFIPDAWQRFGHIQGGWTQMQAVCDWLHGNIAYGKGSTASTTGWDAYQARTGVCRDFAHLGVSFARALNFPARYVCGYLPDIGVPFDPTPMDFHAWFEVYLDGAWRTFDARHNRPRIGRVLIARGRDAVDTAFATIYGGSRLTWFSVWADQVDDTQRLTSHPVESGQSS
jgi:transglutaminase-like putative cysteine protease